MFDDGARLCFTAGVMKTAEFDYQLPTGLIAQAPAPERTASRMLVLHRQTGAFEHRSIRDIGSYLRSGDVLVVNDTRVIPARLTGRRTGPGGGKVELLLVEERAPGSWEAMYHTARPPRPGDCFILGDCHIDGRVIARREGGRIEVHLTCEGDLQTTLDRYGITPLPPYIRRDASTPEETDSVDRERYQTVYARVPGAVAAPTAGLHFDKQLLDALAAQGVARTAVTLHVGPGTFRPVKSDRVETHVMEAERYEIAPRAASVINHARSAGGRIIAVGTTSVRTLESVAEADGHVAAGQGRTSIFIHPPHKFKVVDGLLTNFHLPRSTLLMLVSAFAGVELVRRAYEEAIRQRYRFYSYGDCMLII